MAWVTVVREKAQLVNGVPTGTGRFVLTAMSDDGGGGPHACCDHEHLSSDDAGACGEARLRCDQICGMPPGLINPDVPAHAKRIPMGGGAFSWLGDDQLNAPKWEDAGPRGDWRNYIAPTVRQHWNAIALETRRALGEAALLTATKENEFRAAQDALKQVAMIVAAAIGEGQDDETRA